MGCIFLMMYLRIIGFFIYDFFWRPDFVIISRGLLPRFLIPPLSSFLKILSSLSKNIIWDFDDDILSGKEISKQEFLLLEKLSSNIIVTHSYLASKLNEDAFHKCQILPTTDGDFESLNIRSLIMERSKTIKDYINIIWIGSAVNLRYLKGAMNALEEASFRIKTELHRSVNLIVCSSEELIYDSKSLRIQNIKWTPENAINSIKISHIGIMPLLNEKYALGKGGFKLIQYMAAGLPIIGSNIGFNNSIIQNNFGRLIKDIKSHEEWFDAVTVLTKNLCDYISVAMQARDEYERKYHFNNNLQVWRNMINLNET